VRECLSGKGVLNVCIQFPKCTELMNSQTGPMLNGSEYEFLLHLRANAKVPTKPKTNAPAEIPARRVVEYFSFCVSAAPCVRVFSSSLIPGTHALFNHVQNGRGQFCGVFPMLQTSKEGMPNPCPSPASLSSCPSLQVLVKGFHAQTVSIPSSAMGKRALGRVPGIAVAPLHAAIVLCKAHVLPSLPSSPMATTTHRRNCADHPHTPSCSAVLSAESP